MMSRRRRWIRNMQGWCAGSWTGWLREGITVVVSTHDVDFAYGWADDVFFYFTKGECLFQEVRKMYFANRTALEMTNLEQPAALKLFDSLCRKGILKADLPFPRNLKTLEDYIARTERPIYTGGIRDMNKEEKKGILVVSFGTSVNETREKTIDVIEDDIRRAFPDCALYRAWTSGMIIRKIQKRDGVHIDTVTEAAQRMLEDGITEVLVQPTHVINGVENDLMIQDMLAFQGRFDRIAFGNPLLTSEEDSEEVVRALMEEYQGPFRRRSPDLHGTRYDPLCEFDLCGAGLSFQGIWDIPMCFWVR